MNTNTQHGRTSTPQQAAPPTDPRTRRHSPPSSSTSGDSAGGICRDFIWGICSMGAQCIYRHELEFEAMKAVLKFCHDHQNRTGCTRPDCTYLHTSRDEQNLFLSTGQIPRVLIDRYSGISNTSTPAPPVNETVTSVPPQPHHNMMYEYITQPPPPPPPPPTQVAAGAAAHHSPMLHGAMQGPMGPISGPLQGPMPGPMQGPVSGPMQGPILGPMHGPMPMPSMPAPMPPPPPPPPPTSSESSARMAGPLYTSPLPAQSTQNIIKQPTYHPPLPHTILPAMFDPTRPPPPIPQAVPGRALKRATDDCQAGPSKVRNVEHTNDCCEYCLQRLLRIDQLTRQREQLAQEAEDARNDLALRMFDYEKKKQILRSILNSDIYQRSEDYGNVSGSTSPLSERSEFYSTGPFSSQMPASLNTNSNVVDQLIDRLLGGSPRTLMESLSSSASDDVDLLPLAARARANNSSSDLLSRLRDLVRNDREGVAEAELGRPSVSGNGYSRYLGASTSSLARPLYATGAPAGLLTAASARPFHETGAPAGLLPSASLRPYADGAVGGSAPLPYTEAAPAALPYVEAGPPRYPPPPRPFPPPPAPAEPPAPTPQPPAARPFASHTHFAPNNMPNPPYPGAALNQPPRPPMPPPNNPYFAGGRYPNQHYYHSYQ